VANFRFILLIFLFTGCAGIPYHPSDELKQGYRETRMGEDVYTVEFQGPPLMSLATARDLNLLSGAELTLQDGFSYLEVLEKRLARFKAIKGDTMLPIYGVYNGTVDVPLTTTVIRMFFEEPGGENREIYEAKAAKRKLAEKYRLSL
jgi:hypothetical protein